MLATLPDTITVEGVTLTLSVGRKKRMNVNARAVAFGSVSILASRGARAP
jgi:hypothetical protein